MMGTLSVKHRVQNILTEATAVILPRTPGEPAAVNRRVGFSAVFFARIDLAEIFIDERERAEQI
jgi:hypothetical protein